MLLYYITDRRQFPGDESARRRALLAKIAEAARCGVDYIQLREKDLPMRALESLAHEAVQAVRQNTDLGDTRSATREMARTTGHWPLATKILINARLDVALACGADGVHLPAGEISASDARAAWDLSTRNAQRETRNVFVGVSCHSLADVLAAESHGADFAVFGPVFEKVQDAPRPGAGLSALRDVCRHGARRIDRTESAPSGPMPVLAIGGVSLQNARACLNAGAAGIAAIRLFQENDISEVIAGLRDRGLPDDRRPATDD